MRNRDKKNLSFYLHLILINILFIRNNHIINVFLLKKEDDKIFGKYEIIVK